MSHPTGHETPMLRCSEEGCTAEVKAHRWGQTIAQGEGWFFSRDGQTRWCPEHTPAWVAQWRLDQRVNRGLD